MVMLTKPRCKSQNQIDKSNISKRSSNIRSYSVFESLSNNNIEIYYDNSNQNYRISRKDIFKENRKDLKQSNEIQSEYYFNKNNDSDDNPGGCKIPPDLLDSNVLDYFKKQLANTTEISKIRNDKIKEMKRNKYIGKYKKLYNEAQIFAAKKYFQIVIKKTRKYKKEMLFKLKKQPDIPIAPPVGPSLPPPIEPPPPLPLEPPPPPPPRLADVIQPRLKELSLNDSKIIDKLARKQCNPTPQEPYLGKRCIPRTESIYNYPQSYGELKPDVVAKLNVNSLVSKPYQRAFKKLSFTNYDNMSPIKPSEANLRPVTLGNKLFNIFQGKDNFIFGYTWIVNMTEQFYYDNSLILLKHSSESPEKLQFSLKSSFNPRDHHYFFRYWKDISLAGTGGFGMVYKVFDSKENRFIAVKIIKNPADETILRHRRLLLNFLTERRYILNSNKSPYVISFLYSGKLPSSSSLMLVFEYCITDLDKAFTAVHSLRLSNRYPNYHSSIALMERVPSYLTNIYDQFSSKSGVNIYPIVVLYIFEMFCALDFLAQRNIIHRDIKPQNIMIGENLHLKMADFGLIYNTSFVTRKTQITLVDHSDIDKTESTNYRFDHCGGTTYFYDTELCFHTFKTYSAHKSFMKKNSKNIRPFKYFDFDPLQDFMSDLFSIGLTMCHVLFLGEDPFLNMSPIVKSSLNLSKGFIPERVKLFLLEQNWSNYVKEGLESLGDQNTEELLKILVSTLDLRVNRGKDFVEYKNFYIHGGIKRILPCFSIKNFENISTFKSSNMNSQNAYLFPIDSKFGEIINVINPQIEILPNFRKLMNSLKDIPNKAKIYPLVPGTVFGN